MADEFTQGREMDESEAVSTLNREFAGVLASILDAASNMFPSPRGTAIRLSVALVGDLEKDEFGDMTRDFPVIAGIALSEEIGTKAVLLIDTSTAAVLAGLVNEGRSPEKTSLDDEDLASLHEAFRPIRDALSLECEEALGHSLGAIETIELADPFNPPPTVREISRDLADRLCRATASVTVGSEEIGQIVLVLPRDLARDLTLPRSKEEDITISPREAAELQREDPGPAVSESEQAELQAELQEEEIDAIISTSDAGRELPSQEEIDSLMPRASGTRTPVAEETPPTTSPAPGHRNMSEQSIQNMDLILDIQLRLTARLGQMEMPIGEIMRLAPGSVIDIDRFVDEPVELVVNDRPIARGDIVVVQENFGVRISEIISPKDRIKSLR